MKKLFVIMAMAAFLAATAGTAFSFSFGDDYYSSSLDEATKQQSGEQQGGWGPGPAPNSGDCYPDGPGWEGWDL